ncbi:MAG: helix-hairpin-helix domain-containing protein [Steroidobacteraceae bacterium]|nr:helix-hairpin-helix domain-containing protein [Steroidobacteraceae bacterium]
MRRSPSQSGSGGWRPPRDWRRTLAIIGAVLGVASAAIWFYRDVRSVVPDFGPGEGSLVVNINTASQAELETVPGIGPTRAAQIIAGRPYARVEDLERLNGIGVGQVRDMSVFLTTDGPATRKLESTKR